ncbi:MAG: nitroreductase family protein [Candidatus Acidiferrales bacterium]
MALAKRPAETSSPIHDIINHRWSPRAYENKPVEPEKLRSLFEAARWAASSYNDQPWFFIVTTKDDTENHKLALDGLVEFNQGWAKHAPVLGFSVARKGFGHNGESNSHSWHDVGQAMATLALQAEALGLQVHQMAGIVPDKIRKNFGIPNDFEPVAGFVIGYPAPADALPAPLKEKETAPRQRKPLESFVFGGPWGKTAPFAAPKK